MPLRLRTLAALACASALAGAWACVGASSTVGKPAEREVTLVVPVLEGGAVVMPADGVVFVRPMPVVGERWSVTTEASSVAVVAGGDQRSTFASAYDVQVLAVRAHAPTRVRVHFTAHGHGYQGTPLPSPIDTKSYIVDVDAPAVRSEQDAAAPEEEMQAVLDVLPDLGTRGRIDEVLPDHPMKIGDTRDDLVPALLRTIHPRAWTAESGHAALARIRDDLAVFRIELVGRSARGVRLEVAGEAMIRVRDTRLVRLELEGTYTELGSDAGTPATFRFLRVVRPLS